MKKLAVSVSLLSVLLLVGCGNRGSKSSADNSKSSSSKVVSSKNVSKIKQNSTNSSSEIVSSSSAVSSSAQESSENNTDLVKKDLVGQGFKISPVLYNGEDIDQAMDEQKAPTNTVTDYTVLIYFNDAGSVTSKHLGQVRPDNENYSISNDILTLGDYQVPYSFNNGTITFSQWTASDNQGGTITYQITSYNYVGDSGN